MQTGIDGGIATRVVSVATRESYVAKMFEMTGCWPQQYRLALTVVGAIMAVCPSMIRFDAFAIANEAWQAFKVSPTAAQSAVSDLLLRYEPSAGTWM